MIRPAVLEDLEAIVVIHNDAIRSGASGHGREFGVAEREEWFRAHSDRRPILVAEEEGTILGWADLMDYRPGRRAFLHTAEISFFVHTDHRRKGVGSSLLREILGLCPEIGVKAVLAIVLENNARSIELLEKLSFSRWGHLPGVGVLKGEEVGHVYYGARIPQADRR